MINNIIKIRSPHLLPIIYWLLHDDYKEPDSNSHMCETRYFYMYIYLSINKVYKKSFQKKMTDSSWLNFHEQNLIPPISLLCSKDLQFFYKETSEIFTPFFVRSFLYRFLLIRYSFF